jgi:hypothetical protein
MRGTTGFSALRIGGGNFSRSRLWLIMMLILVTFPLHAKRDAHGNEPDTFDFDETLVEQWKESDVAVPPYPNDRDLLAVPMPSTGTLKIYIDRPSISRAPDRVARFTLVTESPSGARNVFYDGLRCETRQYKTYAIGTANRTLVPVENPTWRIIPRPAINAFRDYLYRSYVCDKHDSARTPEDLVRLIKHGL